MNWINMGPTSGIILDFFFLPCTFHMNYIFVLRYNRKDLKIYSGHDLDLSWFLSKLWDSLVNLKSGNYNPCSMYSTEQLWRSSKKTCESALLTVVYINYNSCLSSHLTISCLNLHLLFSFCVIYFQRMCQEAFQSKNMSTFPNPGAFIFPTLGEVELDFLPLLSYH